jgi:serine/threonine protein kinase
MSEAEGAPRPERIGPYQILGVLGSGGMGVVYRARDPRLSREVALKVIHRTSEGDPRWRQRFAAEARAAAALNHPKSSRCTTWRSRSTRPTSSRN